jgi:outer membrane protein OmpA-like peptidoglycan-associated protein
MHFRIVLRTSALLCGLIVFHGWTDINTEGLDGVVRTVSAKPLGKLKLDIGISANFAQSGNFVQGPTKPPNDTFGRVVDHTSTTTILSSGILQDPAKLFSSNVFLGIGLMDFWDIGVALPFYYDWAGFGDMKDGGLGDLQVAAKFLLPPISLKKMFYAAVMVSASLPTGTRGSGIFPRFSNYVKDDTAWNPASNFYSSGYMTIKPVLALTFDIGSGHPKAPLRLNINIGSVMTEADEQNSLVAGMALEWMPAEFITMFAEVSSEPRLKNLSSFDELRKDPFRATPGIRISTPSGMYLCLSGDFSLSSTRRQDRLNWQTNRYEYSTGVIPRYGVQLTLGWNGFMTTLDDDKDGILNSLDKCPRDPEDFDGFEDSDGCPDPDNDKDGIFDPWVATQGKQGLYESQCKGSDKCPNAPEDVDGFQDDDGCPDADNDGDGILDQKDQCPNNAEDFDGFQDSDGCPDYDNDKDGVPDSTDKCPNDPEDRDGFQDSDGCPDVDNDKDGIPDLKDKCPDAPEIFNGYMDEDGCPDTVPKPEQSQKKDDFPSQQVLEGLDFEKGKADIVFESYRLLDRLAKSLREYPNIEIEIRGYTDGMGKPTTNIQLSQRRAEAVRRYLINQGIEPSRVRAMGFGPSNPVGDNRTADGRAMNRRIEVIRTK